MTETQMVRSGVVRREEWRQATPQDQLVTILGAARGIADNAAAGVYSDPERLKQRLEALDGLLEQAIQLTQLVDGQWPDP
jgi:hypothetical protein